MNKRLILIMLVLAVTIGGTIYAIGRAQAAPTVEYSADLLVQLNGGNIEGYDRAYEVRPFTFPQDHGPHPNYLVEWWYFTGNLETAEGRRFGYQLALFRRALTPTMPARQSDWASNQVFFGDFALTNVADGQFYSNNRFSRGAAGLAGATVDPRFRVWIEDWSVTAVDDQATRLNISAKGISEGTPYAINLQTTMAKPIVLQGDRGLSQKNSERGNASYYYSMPRLTTTGAITVAGRDYAVTGNSWMDKEFSTSVLGDDAAGWDWFALQLDNGRDLMLYYIRRKDGTPEPLSSGALIEADGTITALPLSAFQIDVINRWTSPRTGADYPSGWRVRVNVPSGPIALEIQPLLVNQELNSVTAYWEGASRITGTDGATPVSGYGYVELTGYNAMQRGDSSLTKTGP